MSLQLKETGNNLTMQDISIAHTDFAFANSLQYELSISLRRDGFSFSICSVDSRKIMAVYFQSVSDSISHQEYNLACTKFLFHEAFNHTYNKVSVIYATPKVTIIPSEFFTETQLHKLFVCNHEVEVDEELKYYKIKNTDSLLLYAISKKTVENFTERFKNTIEWYPQSAPFFETSIIQNQNTLDTTIFVSLESTFFDVLILQSSNVLLYNTYEFSNVNDYVYYVMNIYEQLRLDTLTTPIILSGRISESSSYFDATKMFIKQVSIVKDSTTNKVLVAPFNEVSYPIFTQLLHLDLCV